MFGLRTGRKAHGKEFIYSVEVIPLTQSWYNTTIHAWLASGHFVTTNHVDIPILVSAQALCKVIIQTNAQERVGLDRPERYLESKSSRDQS